MDKFAEDVTIYRQNGQCIKTKALVQKVKIFIKDVTIPICVGDVIERVLPSGIKERLAVTNATCNPNSRLLAHWEIEYEKEGSVKHSERGINLAGSIYANRVYIQSTDNSTNITNLMDNSVFEELRKLIEEKIENNGKILEALSDLEENVNKPTALDKFNNFIQIAADYMTLIAPFLPAIGDVIKSSVHTL